MPRSPGPVETEPLGRDLLNNDFARAAFPEAKRNRVLVGVLSVLSFAALLTAFVLPLVLVGGLLHQGWAHRSFGQLSLGGVLLVIGLALLRRLLQKKTDR